MMQASSLHLTKFIALLIIGFVFIAEAYLQADLTYVGLAVLTVGMFVLFWTYASTSLGAVLLFCGTALFVVPTYSLLFVESGVTNAWFALFLIVATAMLSFFRPDPMLSAFDGRTVREMLAIVALCLIALLSQALHLIEPIFYAVFALAVLHLERLHACTQAKFVRFLALGITLLTIGVYMLTFWGGFGRLILTSLALAPILVSVRYGTFRLNALVFSVVAGALVFLGRVLRFGWSDGVAGLADDSGASPLTYTQALWGGTFKVFYSEPFWHQWSLLVIQWFPRSVWPDKPMGINYTFVDFYIGRQGLGEEHSTAIGLFGEHIFLAGNGWILSIAVLVLVIVMFSRIVRWIGRPYAAPSIMFNCWLVTLFWGGMADFGSRVWYSVVPMLAYAHVLQRIRAPKSAAASGMAVSQA